MGRRPPESVARSVPLPPDEAMDRIQRTFRCTLNEHLFHYRVALAQRPFTASEMKVLDVAMGSGFPTSSRCHPF